MLEKIIIFILKLIVFFGYFGALFLAAKTGNILLFFILFFILIAFILIGNMETGKTSINNDDVLLIKTDSQGNTATN